MGLHRLLQTIRAGYGLRSLQELLSLPRSAEDEQPAVVWGGLQSLDDDAEEVERHPVGKVEYFLLKARERDPQMEVAIVRLPEGETTTGPLKHEHGGDEILMGLKGTTEVMREPDGEEPEVHTIGRGQLILHRASVTHYARNASRQGDCVYMVIRAPYGLTWPTVPRERRARPQS
jgi:mannose-6-phosphate isomerase-like protein (cupin superfamily)